MFVLLSLSIKKGVLSGDPLAIRWSSWWSMPKSPSSIANHFLGRSASNTIVGDLKPLQASPLGDPDVGRLLSAEGADMDSADRSFLEYGLASGTERLTSTGSGSRNLTNSDSCQDWTGENLVLLLKARCHKVESSKKTLKKV